MSSDQRGFPLPPKANVIAKSCVPMQNDEPPSKIPRMADVFSGNARTTERRQGKNAAERLKVETHHFGPAAAWQNQELEGSC